MFNERSVRNRFVKESKLPIPVLDSPYFEYFLDMYEGHLGARTKYEGYLDLNLRVEDYMVRYNKFKDSMIDYVKSNDRFNEFSNTSYEFRSIPSINLFSEDNCGGWISIDLKSANFNVLRRFDKSLVGGFDSYEEFAKSFEGGELFSDSKATRQVIFGNLNPKKLQNHQKYCMGMIAEYIELHFGKLEMFSLGSDEIVIRYDEAVYSTLVSESVLRDFEKLTGFVVKVDRFMLEKNGEYSEFGFVKRGFDGGFELVAVPKTFYAQAYKSFMGMPLCDNDLMSHHEGFVVKFVETVEDKYRRKSI